MTSTIFFITGLIVGSFLNVVICRLRWAEGFVWGRSLCPDCKSVIRWYDNIPVISFVLLNCKCRDCKKKISWQYPLVEISTGILFLLAGLKFFNAAQVNSWVMTGYILVMFSFLVVIFIYDLLYMEIPGAVLWFAVGCAVFFNVVIDWINQPAVAVISNIFTILTYSGTVAAMVGFLFFFLLVAISKEKWMGMGDAYLAILLGLFLGWPKIFLALTLSFGIGAIVGVILIGLKIRKMKSQIPFAPFLVLGTMVSVFFYEQIVEWYLRLLMG